MRSSLIRVAGVVLGGLALPSVAAVPARAEVKTPYVAEVMQEGVTVRSGNTRQCYPTGTLRRGDRVTVHRHDYGGWFMIAPPPGSFSWIRAEYVQRSGNTGTVRQNDVVVWVGSQFGDEHSVEQIRLSSGDTVEILGEKVLAGGSAPQAYLKIKPPQNEYRWIEGKYVAPADPAARAQHDRNPFNVPSTARGAEPAPPTPAAPPQGQLAEAASPLRGDWQVQKTSEPGPTLGRPVTRTDGDDAVRRNAPPEDILEADRQRLKELDDRFREIIRKDPREWDLSALERDYRALHASASHPALRSQVELRFPALDRYKTIKTEYDDLVRLTTETSRRDAELVSMQRQALEQATAPPVQPQPEPTPATPRPQPTPVVHPQPTPVVQPRPTPAAQPEPVTGPILGPPEPVTTPTPPQPPAARPAPKFDGAGIVQRLPAPRGAIRHVLVAPDGRVLAFLQAAPGVNLDAHVGQPVGLFGPRSHNPSLRSDYLYVRSLMPVRLSR